jgi:hypothetical protein
MENLSSWFVIVVFGLGSAVGGLLVSLQRQCVMERIRQEFEQELAATVLKQSSYDRRSEGRVETVGVAASPLRTEAEIGDEPEEELDGWENAFVPVSGSSGHTHAGV